MSAANTLVMNSEYDVGTVLRGAVCGAHTHTHTPTLVHSQQMNGNNRNTENPVSQVYTIG